MMWFVLLLLYIAHTELVISHEKDDRLILRGGDNACDGHVEVYHNNQWGYVGDSLWDNVTEETVCRSTHCGSRVEGSTTDVDIPNIPGHVHVVWLNEVNCTGNKKHLFDCHYPGWNISVYLKDTVKKIKCSNNIKISLDEFKCAGAVKYSTDENTTSGYFCADGWGESETKILCKELGCGEPKESAVHQWMNGKDFENSKKRMISCKNIMPNNLWQCVGTESQCTNPASVICTGFKRAQLKGNRSNVCSGRLEIEKNGKWITEKLTKPHKWCRQMHCGSSISDSQNDTELQCTDNVNVVLMDGDKPSKCYGTVHINISSSSHPVCASNWTRNEAEVVCSELDCGKAVSFRSIPVSGQRGIMDNVYCSNKEASLWHCWAKHSKEGNLECGSKAYVECAGSIDVTLKDGPGKCAGRVEIKHEGRWKQVYKTKEWTDTNSDTVCEQMKCGKHRKNASPEKFSQRPDDFLPTILACNSNSLTISDCFTTNPYTGSNKEAVGITCEAHKLLFLKEKETKNKSCSGMVGIEHGDNTYWLSGSDKTWNNESAKIVCQQMLCGDLYNFSTAIPTDDMKNNVWDMSSNCLLNNTSMLECENRNQSLGPNVTVATVFCSGSVEVNLTNKCWGNVNVCFDNKCGGVCADTWTEKQSEMLCESLGCLKPITNKDTQFDNSAVIVKSLHATKQTTSLAQYNFVMNDNRHDNRKICNPASVVCSGCLKPRFNISRGKCYGNVEVRYEGSFLPVCTTALTDKKTQDIICKSLSCGQAVGMIDYLGPQKTGVPAISDIQCSGSSLQMCNITTTSTNCIYAGLQCTEWRKMKLSDTCKGAVFVYSEGKRRAVSAEGWTTKERDRLCQDMECGNKSSLGNPSGSGKQNFWNSTFSCSGNNVTNIWDCEKKTPPSKNEQLFIECLVKPSATLSNHCRGEVKIDNIQVCSSQWNMNYSHLICHEKKCSNAIDHASTKPNDKNEYYHVNCADDHELGQCKRVKGKCDGQLVSVFCVGNVKFNTTEKCGGEIEVHYRGKWEKVCSTVLPHPIKKMLCEKLGCQDYINRTTTRNVKVPTLSTSLECTGDHKDISYCVRKKTCNNVKPAEIYCKGYKAPEPIIVPEPINIVPIILGIGLCLILIAIIVFVRICFFKKSKNVMNIPLRMQSRKEVEFESGDYEDVRADEMDDFSRRRFRSEAEIITENDARSASSISYDDIDEAAEAQPLTSQATTAGASRNNHNHEGALDQSDDGVTYEVDDPQENYDDIEGNPEPTQAQAEVHNSPQTTPESKAVDPPGVVQGDVDYLVPGQDG